MRRRHIWIKATAVFAIALVAAPAAAITEAVWLCQMTGELGPRCCCSHGDAADEHEGPRVERQACCSIVDAETAGLAPSAERGAGELAPTFIISARGANPVQAQAQRLLRRSPDAHAPRGPPLRAAPRLFIEHCSYLI